MDEEGPKWRLEHASNDKSTCQQAACKRNGIKIQKGELRIGTNTLFDNDIEHRWYIAWRHWACATKHQILGLKETADNDPSKAPGYNSLSAESQEQVRLAFEEGKPVDKEFKGIREDLAKKAPRYAREYSNATGYKADVATRAAGCRGPDCLSKGVKIVKGELRLGLSIPYDGDHDSWVYKHWGCMSEHDLEMIQDYNERELFYGIESLPDHFKPTVQDTLATGKIIEPPKQEQKITPTPKAKRPRAKKARAEADADDDEEAEAPKPKRSHKKRIIDEVEEASEEERYVPTKTKSRQVPVEEETDPSVARIQALTEQMREKAAK